MAQITLNWIAAPILAQRNIELSQIFCTYNESEQATVYTVHTAEGKIGSFAVPTMVLAEAVTKQTVGDLLASLFETIEFTNGQPTVPAIEPAQPAAEGDSGESGETRATIEPDGAESPNTDTPGGTETTAGTEGEEQGSGPVVESPRERGAE